MQYYLKYNDICLETGNKRGQAIACNNMASIYVHRKDFNNAVLCQKTRLKILKSIGSVKGMIDCCYQLSTLFNKQKDFDKAIYYIDKAIEIMKEESHDSLAEKLQKQKAFILNLSKAKRPQKELKHKP